MAYEPTAGNAGNAGTCAEPGAARLRFGHT